MFSSLFTLLATICANIAQETPTESNATMESYIYTTSLSTAPARTIICGSSDLCFIKCSGELSCASSTISASASANLVLRCVGRYACRTLTISAGPTSSADIECVSQFGYACGGSSTSYYSTFILSTTPTINILCDQVDTSDATDGGSCYGLTVRAANADQVSIDCMDYEDCYSSDIYVDSVSSLVSISGYGERSLLLTTIYGASATELSLDCKAKTACSSATIYPPYDGAEYAFQLFCLYIYQSCYNVKVRIPNSESRTENFMEMICPKTSRGSYTCDIDFYCDDLSTGTAMTYATYSSPRYICNDQDCCPWTDYDNIVQSSTVTEALPNAISATSYNETAEWYEITSAELYQMISCSKQACYIECPVVNACRYAAVYAGLSEYLQITCSGTSACEYMYIYEGPTVQADIFCTAKLGTGCGLAVFLLPDTPVVNIQCAVGTSSSSNGNCYYMVLNAENTANLTVDCKGDYACEDGIFRLYNTESIVLNADYRALDGAYVYAQTADYLEINCNSKYSCQSMIIYPPYANEYGFNMYCAPHSYSCYNVKVKVASSTSYAENYMSLFCPRTNTRSYACDIDFYCLDISTSSSSTYMAFNTFIDRYYCYGTSCCPWAEKGFYSPYTFKPGTTRSVLPNSIEATSTDSSGEYYTISASSTDLQEISCTNSAGCYIRCTDSDACEFFVIYAGATEYLQLVCEGQRSCERVYITMGPSVQADINCTASLGYACQYSTFILEETDVELNLFCDSDTSSSSTGGCYLLQLWAPFATEANIYCDGAYSCEDAVMVLEDATLANVVVDGYRGAYDTTLYAENAGRLNMECNGEYACYSCDVNAPHYEEYVYRLVCGEATSACDYLEVKVEDTSVNENNYMSLECEYEYDASGNTYYSYSTDINCDVRFFCDSTSYDTTMTWSRDNERVECTDDDCCPWSDVSYMTAPKECIFEDGEFCGSSLFVKGFNIWTLELSGNSILDIDYLQQNTESWTDEGSSCALSSLEFSSSYSSYSDYAAADATNIDGAYSSGENAAGGSLSTARTESKSYAGKEQSYIYSMDVSCSTASASTVAANSIYWNANFVNTLRLLPSVYLSAYMDDYIDFWNSYGTHIMKTAELGGRVRGSIVSSKCSVMSSYGDAQSYELCLNGAYQGAEVAGCGGESESSSSNNTAALLVTRTLIDVKGGDSAAFSSVFQQFQSKSNDFQSWINDLAVTPDVIGGNLGAIHDVILNAIALGSHRLNDDLSSANQKTDSEWTNIANALSAAFEERSATLIATETFDSDECEISVCEGGQVDEETCSCSGCGSSGCCVLNDDSANAIFCNCFWIYVFFCCFACFLSN